MQLVAPERIDYRPRHANQVSIRIGGYARGVGMQQQSALRIVVYTALKDTPGLMRDCCGTGIGNTREGRVRV